MSEPVRVRKVNLNSGIMKSKRGWNIRTSRFAENSINPIREIVENMSVEPNPKKDLIPLSIGDPTLFGNLKPCEEIMEALATSLTSGKYNGYQSSTGLESARDAVAEYCSVPGAEIDCNDVFLTSGCSHALDLSIAVLGDVGKNMLIPRPGFPLYKTLCAGYGVEVRSYDLSPQNDWEVDVDHLESIIDHNTVAILYNNPSNPCGSVFSKAHILSVLAVAESHCLPIIADEIYENMVFPGKCFIPIASLTTEVPVLSCRGTTKRFLIPGMRLGWITLHDRHNRLGHPIRRSLNQLCQRIMGANGVMQGALASILKSTPQNFFDNAIDIIKENADYVYNTFMEVPGLHPIKPSGAMYIMVGVDIHCFPDLKSDLDFVEKLVAEESVFCLPGRCFDYANYIRIVLTVPSQLNREACDRISHFCSKYFVYSNGVNGDEPWLTSRFFGPRVADN